MSGRGPDAVEEGELVVGVEAEVADQLSDVGPVLLLDVGAVVLVADRDRVKVILCSVQ